MASRWTRLRHGIIDLFEWWDEGLTWLVGGNVPLAQICMEGKMLDVVLGLILGVVRFKRHAVVAHTLWTVTTELRVLLAGDLAFLCLPVRVHAVLFGSLPWLFGSRGRC